MIKEIHDRESKGLLKKGWSVTEKNRIAMKFVDLVDKVETHQKLAMKDKRLDKLNKYETANFIENRVA